MSGFPGSDDPTDSFRWWLRLQVGIAVAGASAWVVGALLGEDFLSGVGCGLLVAALMLRLGRVSARAQEDS